MYNEKLSVENKIITSNDLLNIFNKMNEVITKYKKIADYDEARNRGVDFQNQVWTIKYFNKGFKLTINFYDNTEISFDDYNNFLGVFNSRIEDIKEITCSFHVNFSKKNEFNKYDDYHSRVYLWIREKKANLEFDINSGDSECVAIYELIKNIIQNAPSKYDEIVSKKDKITRTVGLAIGFIPAMIIAIIPMFFEITRNIYLNYYVVYPVVALILGYLIGGSIGASKLDKYYESIVPDKKYAGYDRINNKSIYKDDIDSYVGSSEILIGKNYRNLEYRNIIMREYKKYKALLPKVLLTLLGISVVIIIIGLIIK